jgi:hypothetical protein
MSGKEQLIVAVLSAGLAATGQTKIDLKNQSQGVDFSGAASTKPMKTGAALPSTCSTGEAYFQTNAPAGQNLYLCTSTNIWSLESGGSGGASGTLTMLAVTRTGSTTLAVGASCAISTPCTARIGGTVYTIVTGSTITLTSGTPAVRIYISDGSDGAPLGTVKVRNSALTGVACSSGCTVENSQTAFPGMSIPLAIWTATTPGAWDATGTDLRSFLSAKPSASSGTGIVITQGASDTVAIDTTLVLKKYSGAGAPGSIAGSLLGDIYIDTANNVSYQCFSAGPCTAVGTGNWQIR